LLGCLFGGLISCSLLKFTAFYLDGLGPRHYKSAKKNTETTENETSAEGYFPLDVRILVLEEFLAGLAIDNADFANPNS